MFFQVVCLVITICICISSQYRLDPLDYNILFGYTFPCHDIQLWYPLLCVVRRSLLHGLVAVKAYITRLCRYYTQMYNIFICSMYSYLIRRARHVEYISVSTRFEMTCLYSILLGRPWGWCLSKYDLIHHVYVNSYKVCWQRPSTSCTCTRQTSLRSNLNNNWMTALITWSQHAIGWATLWLVSE